MISPDFELMKISLLHLLPQVAFTCFALVYQPTISATQIFYSKKGRTISENETRRNWTSGAKYLQYEMNKKINMNMQYAPKK